MEPAPAYGVLHLDAVDPIPVAGVRWKPVRRTLGIEAFGINAYTADFGEHVVEDHDETGGGAGGHEEVYAVIAGRAKFTVAGDEIDAGPGTLVFVRDPNARRSAVAAADGTTVLALGGTPGEAFRPSPWEWSFAAEPLVRAGDHEAAIAIMWEAVELHPDNASTLYNLGLLRGARRPGGRGDRAPDPGRRARSQDGGVGRRRHRSGFAPGAARLPLPVRLRARGRASGARRSSGAWCGCSAASPRRRHGVGGVRR